MNVSLTPQLERFIENKVKEGTYQTASEVVRDALRYMAEREQRHQAAIQRLRAELTPALDALDRGEDYDLDVEEIKAEGRRRLAGRTRKKKVG